MSDSRLVFLIGTGRCGSSLLHELLARHDDVGFLTNVEDRLPALGLAGPGLAAAYRRLPSSAARKGRPRLAPSEGYRALAREVSPLLCDPTRDLSPADASPWLLERLRSFFHARAARHRRAVFLHKFTGWPRVGLLREAFPDARFVHVVRDGRAVAASWVQMPWWRGHRGPEGWHFGPLPVADAEAWESGGRCFVHLAGLAWKQLVDAAESIRPSVPPDQWTQVRYEDLVADPAGRSGQVLDFMRLHATPAFARALTRQGLHARRATSFRSDLTADQVERLDVALERQLRRYGYPGSGPHPRAHGPDRAADTW